MQTEKHVDILQEIFFLPPMAIARCGSSPTPVDGFRWIERSILRDSPTTVIEPDISLKVENDGSVTAELPKQIVFRDEESGPIRPVAPFFELWGKFQSVRDGKIYEVPLTSALLHKLKVPLTSVWYEINAANRKVERRTGNPSCGFVARELVNGADHVIRELNAFSPHTSGQEPLVYQDNPILVGFFHVLRPAKGVVKIGSARIDRDILRVRFTPPKGLVYGPPTATTGPAQEVPPGVYEAPATQFGRIHEIVPPERRILNANTEWSRYVMMTGEYEDPAPQDGYDGATVGNHQSWGCVDDSTDSLIHATMVVDGRLYRAAARVFVGPPDFAPDRRPVYSIADDLADREKPLIELDQRDLRETTAEVLDIFHRAFDAASLFNLDAERARALQENRVRFARHSGPEGLDEPSARDASMTAQDEPYVDKLPVLASQSASRFTDATPNDPLPYSEVVHFVHGPLKNEAVLLDFLSRRGDLVKKIVRPAFGSFAELPTEPAANPDPNFRDPRVFRDQLHDMRMPPYMRDANLQPLSLNRRQYRELMDFISLLPARSHKDGNVRSATRDRARLPQQDFRERIFPRNLTARAAQAARVVTGNPVTTRLESAVGNCFPGLEFDVRVLDRRFFPGLVFQYVQVPRPEYVLPGTLPDQQGAHLIYADWFLDPMLPETSSEQWVQDLLAQYRLSPGQSFMGGRWYLDWIEQDGKRISMRDQQGAYYDGYMVWRFVRGLVPGKELRIGIIDRSAADPKPVREFRGYRRPYVNEAGVIDEAFRPGELTHSMCNPWSHDFRDCACHYWPTNHPDVVMRRSVEFLPDGRPKDPTASSIYVNWNRLRGPASEIPAFDTLAKNRPYEMDHYQINTLWETLPFVVEGREIGSTYAAPPPSTHDPFPNLAELIDELQDKLAPMELALAMQYLYALFSLRDPDEIDTTRDPRWLTLRDDLKAIRQFLLLVAVGEMAHLRCVNQMLWELGRGRFYPNGRSYRPVLDWNDQLAITDKRGQLFELQLRRLTPETLAEFIHIERPTGKLSAAYGRCVATLKDHPDLKNVYDLALRIDGEGIDHFETFSNMKRVLDGYGANGDEYPYLRTVEVTRNADTREAVDLFDKIRLTLADAYFAEAATDPDYTTAQKHIKLARESMRMFQAKAEALAKQGFGVPLTDGRRPLLGRDR
jgi:hypothetical protein